jgi:hypothetical protein
MLKELLLKLAKVWQLEQLFTLVKKLGLTVVPVLKREQLEGQRLVKLMEQAIAKRPAALAMASSSLEQVLTMVSLTSASLQPTNQIVMA